MSPRTRWMSAAIVFRKSYVGRSTTFPVHRMCWILPVGEKRYEREAGGGSESRMDKCGEAWGWRARIGLVSLSSYTPFSYLRSCSVRGVKIGRSPRRPLILGSRLHSGAVCDHRKWERGAGVVVGSRHVLVAPSPHAWDEQRLELLREAGHTVRDVQVANREDEHLGGVACVMREAEARATRGGRESDAGRPRRTHHLGSRPVVPVARQGRLGRGAQPCHSRGTPGFEIRTLIWSFNSGFLRSDGVR